MTQKNIIADRYLISQKLDEGGMGLVYLGQDLHTDTPIVIKQLRASYADEVLIERFKQEGQALRDLDHPNIVKLLDAVEANGAHYLVIEYVSGGNLRQALRDKPHTLNQILHYAIDLADALTRAHKLNIIHRDLKPENILIAEDGTLRLTDFGLANIGNKTQTSGYPTKLIGTATYFAPELLKNQPASPRSDIWAFGLLLLEAVTGVYPFNTNNFMTLLYSIQHDPLPDLETQYPDLPIMLVDLIYRMLMRDPNERIPSVRHVGAMLEDVLFERVSGVNGQRFESMSYDLAMPETHNLPIQATPFVGREVEIEQVIQTLTADHNRMLSIVAPGGMGKTRLALAVAESILGTNLSVTTDTVHFTDGIYFVNLSPLSDPDTIINAIAEAIGYHFRDDARTPPQQIYDHLSTKTMLLVLDNFEHLLAGKTFISDLLQQTQGITVLVTSRVRLGIAGEMIFHLSGVTVPTDVTLDNAMHYAAIQLFVNSARRVAPDFVLTSDDLSAVATICQQVQGMPLAIVLAASWIGMLSPDEILQEIETGLDFFEAESANLPDRQQSILHVFNYSWEHLSPTEQAIFMKMSVFRGGFSRQAGQTITGATLRQFMSLMNRSLLLRDPETGRYSIHALLRQYAEEKLKRYGDEAGLVVEHAKYYASALARQMPQLASPQQLTSMKNIELDSENVRVAWLKSLKMGRYDVMDTMLHGLWIYYISRDQQMMVDDLFAPLYAVVNQTKHPSPQLQQLWQRVIFRWAGAYQTAPHRAKFPVHISAVQALVEQIDDVYERAVGQYCLGWYFTVTNDMPSSQTHLLISDALLAQLDEKYLRSIVLARLGFIEIVNGNQDAFLTYAEHSVKLTEELGVSIQRFAPLNNLGAVAFFLGDYEEARRRFYETSVLISQSRYYTMVFPFSNLALIDFITGDFEASQRMLTKIDKLVGSAFSTSGYGLALAVKGMLLTTQGRYAEGLEAGQRSFDYASNVSVRFSSRLALAMAYVGLSDFEKSQQVLLESLDFLHPVDNYRGVVYLSIPMLAAIRHHWGQSYIATEYLSMAFHHLPKSQSFIHKWQYIDELKQALRMTLSPTDFERAWTGGRSLDLTTAIQDFLNDARHAQEMTE